METAGNTVNETVPGNDGDDIGKLTKVKFRVDGNGDLERLMASMAPADLMQSGHGFLVRSMGGRPKTVWPTSCELCGSTIIAPAEEWLCQLGNFGEVVEPDGPFRSASTTCNCNWCLHYQMWLRGEYRPKGGRPAKRCGSSDCKKIAARNRKRKSRADRSAAMSQKPHN